MRGRKGIAGALAGASLAAVLAAGMAAPGAAWAAYRGFDDIPEDHWAVESGVVDWALDNGVIHGFPDGRFAPDGTIDRAQVATVVWNHAGNPDPGPGATFADAGSLDWAAEAAAWAEDEGVFTGVANPDGSLTFDPWSPITREQAAKVLCAYVGGEAGDGASLDGFTDRSSVSGWAEGVVAWAVENGIMGNGGFLAGQSACSRVEFATMLMNVVEGGLAPDPAPQPDPDPAPEPEPGPDPAPSPEPEPDPEPGDDDHTVDMYDISSPGFKVVESFSRAEDGEMGYCQYNGHKLYNYSPTLGAQVFDPDGVQLRNVADDNKGEDHFKCTGSVDYENDTVTYTVTGIGRYHGTKSITVGFSRFSSVYISAPECPACGFACDVDYPDSYYDHVPVLWAYRCVDSSSATPHACKFVEGKTLDNLLLRKDGRDWITLASDEEVLAQDLYCSNPYCTTYGKSLKGKIDYNDLKPFDSYDTGSMIAYH